ncbi:MAG: hypothetical protein R3285_04275 [Kiloniellales bacterium]|nr:hypothetical protein [Kiloniellales bacterium]
MTCIARRIVLTALLASGLLWSAAPPAPLGAQDRKLSAAEIEQRLVGNTIEGLWDGRPYKQFFDASGNTLYVEDGRQPSMGRWKADTEKDAYCSWWEVSGWSCYEVLDGGPDTIIWVSPGSGKEFPAKVLPGDQL